MLLLAGFLFVSHAEAAGSLRKLFTIPVVIRIAGIGLL